MFTLVFSCNGTTQPAVFFSEKERLAWASGFLAACRVSRSAHWIVFAEGVTTDYVTDMHGVACSAEVAAEARACLRREAPWLDHSNM